MDTIITIVATVGVSFLGYIAVEVRGMRNDLSKFAQRLVRVETVSGINYHEK